MQLYLYKPFQKQLLKLERAGGAASMACHQVHAAINNWRHRMPATLPRTKHGESRIPHAVKYDLHGQYRLVTVEHENARLLVYAGSHGDVDRWLDANRGAKFVVNKRGQVDFTRVEAVPLDLEELQDTLPDAPLLSGPVLAQLPPQAIASLGLSDTLRLFFDHLISFERLLDNEGIWQVIYAQKYASDSQRSATLDAVDHLRHGRLPQAIARIEAYAGEATAQPAAVVAALEAGTASDNVANLSALTDDDFEHRFRNSSYAEWLLFLHPDQQKHVDATHSGPSRLLGVSGSGKTCVLVHRASVLAARYPSERILILVLNESLRQLLVRLVEHLCPESQRGQIDVMRIYDYCHNAVKTINPSALINLVDERSGEDLAMCWRDFTRKEHAEQQSATLRANIKAMNVDSWGYLHDELIWVRSGTGVSKSERNAYLTADRKGRSLHFPIIHPAALSARTSKIVPAMNTTTGFAPDTRACVLNLLRDYEEYMADGGLLDEDGVALLAYEYRNQIAKHASLRARCVLVDEAQDCSTTQLGVISQIPTADGDGLMLVGDPVQKVFPRQQQLTRAGIDIRGRAARLNVNYRNTRQILDAAYPIIETYRSLSPITDDEALKPELACRTGPRPRLVVCVNSEEQWQCVEFLVRHLRETGSPSLCVGSPRPAIELPPRRGRVRPRPAKPPVDKYLLSICERNSWPVMGIEGKAKLEALAESVVGARFEDMKGFEFKNVLLVDLQDRPLLPDWIPFKEQWRVAFQLYVAMTRAQEGLWLFAIQKTSRLLNAVSPYVDTMTPDELLGRDPKEVNTDDADDSPLKPDAKLPLPPIPMIPRLPEKPKWSADTSRSSRDNSATHNTEPSTPGSEDSSIRSLPFNPSKTSTRALIRYSRTYWDKPELYDCIMNHLSDRDTSAFAGEWAELQAHWLELVQAMHKDKSRHSGEPKWPEWASMNRSIALSGRVFPHAEGMLSFMGYQVGMTSELTPTERREILWYVFKGKLPFVLSKTYTEEWGSPGSASRLAKMKITISTCIENARRRRTDMSVAIAEWHADLEYITRHFKPVHGG